ncbi:MAG: phosphoribosylglycinamide formyltransferase [Lysobacterales bacterium CG_4_10_14_3_um_filter_64_11]|nr:MAG: phosphoribosylglycinamide formyltransferase [Xanthomonadales bacterium CG_4_10_14_3_um_filter_64_11]
MNPDGCALADLRIQPGASDAAQAPLPIVVLASGNGSNLQALIDASASAVLPIRIVAVCSDKPDCMAVQRARQAGIAIWAQRPRAFASRAAFDDALFAHIDTLQPALIVCAGYMRIISATAVQRHAGQMINLHPSLLPRHPGLHTHARALAAGDQEHGASLHLVTAELDAGPIIAQARVAVHGNDSEEALSNRVRAREHPLLVGVVGLLANQRLRIDGNAIMLDGQVLNSPLQLDRHDLLQR